MGKQGHTKRNHFVPRHYLKKFAQETDGQIGVWVYDKKIPTVPPKYLHPDVIGLQVNLYTVLGPGGIKDTGLETGVMTPIENLATPILDRLISTDFFYLSTEEVQVLAWYLALTHLRVPNTISAIGDFESMFTEEYFKERCRDPQKVRQMFKKYREGTGKDPGVSIEEYQQFCAELGTNFKIKVDAQNSLIKSLKCLLKIIYEELLKRNWSILVVPESNFFVTSDSPLTVFLPLPDARAKFGTGFGLPQVEISFPLSPQKCLFISTKQSSGIYRVSDRAVLEFNRRCIRMAQRFIYSSLNSPEIASFVNEFAGAFHESKIDRKKLVRQVRNFECVE